MSSRVGRVCAHMCTQPQPTSPAAGCASRPTPGATPSTSTGNILCQHLTPLARCMGGFHVLMLCRGSARVCAPSCGNATSSQNFTYDPKTKHYTTMARAPVKLYPAGDLLPNPTHMRVYMWGGPCTNDVRWGLHVCIYILYICSARSWNPSAGGPRRDIQGVRLSLGEHAVDGVPIVHCRRRPTHVYDQSVLRCP